MVTGPAVDVRGTEDAIRRYRLAVLSLPAAARAMAIEELNQRKP
jgi:hypothetical protein